MDFQKFVDDVALPCCVMSVKRKQDGTCGDINIICSNASYKETMGPAYYDGMFYHELVPKDPKFESFVFTSAFMKKRLHAYVETKALNAWTDQVIIPIESDDENIGYCQYMFEFTKEGDPNLMSNVSIDNAKAVIQANIELQGSDVFEEGLSKALSDIMHTAEANACRVMLIDHERKIAINFCEVLADRNMKLKYYSEGKDGVISYRDVNSWEEMLGVSNSIIVKEPSEFNRLAQYNPEWVYQITSYNVQSIILVPLKQNKKIIGYLYVTNFNTDKYVEVKEFVELMGFFLSTQISNHLMMNQLETLSKVDTLTDIYNRNEMSEMVKNLQGNSFGLINLDLNGLKAVNDAYGHDEGDKLLVKASDLLKSIFRKTDVYRAGGDEFMVILPNVPEEVFYRKVEALKEVMEKDDGVSFAMGAIFSDGTENTHDVFVRSDELMYEDKKRIYEERPELKRK